MAISTAVVWAFGIISFLYCTAASVYFVISVLNTDLISDALFLWIVLLVMCVLSVVEALYFLLFVIFKAISMTSLNSTLTNILTLYDPIAQIIANIGFLVCVYIYDPAAGNDDGIFQIIVVLLASMYKFFLSYLTLYFNYDSLVYYNSEKEAVVVMSERRGPYTFVPAKDMETAETEKVVPQSLQPVILVPLPHNFPVMYLPKH